MLSVFGRYERAFNGRWVRNAVDRKDILPNDGEAKEPVYLPAVRQKTFTFADGSRRGLPQGNAASETRLGHGPGVEDVVEFLGG